MSGWFGSWNWYCGSDEDDDEMCQCRDRADAIMYGCREFRAGDSFYIVEAKMRYRDEIRMGNGQIDTAPFVKTRNGEWIVSGPVETGQKK